MKKIIILIVLFFTIFNLLGQTCGEVKYTFTTNIAYEYIEQYEMKFNNKESYCNEVNIKYLKGGQKSINEGGGVVSGFIVPRKNLNSKFYYNTKINFYFRDNFIDVDILVKEEKHLWNWKMYKETKQIKGYKCQKATIQFRGRSYIAWFTNEIPTSFGPWKFQGLSGLILEIYDTDNYFHITVDDVKVSKKYCTIKIDKKQFKSAISVNEYLEKRKALLEEELKKITSKMPKGFTIPKKDEDCTECINGIEIFNKK